MGELALLINVHQPVAQDEATLRRVAQYCYLPLIKLIKNNKNHKFTFNIPLSLLEQMEKYGFDSWINDIKELVNLGAIEVVGSGAYHPLLTHLPKSIAQNQIILNEYGLGYYLGRKTGFEGEKAIMINNLVGFYPPELAVNNDLLEILEELGYKWVLIDEFGSKEDDKFGVFSFSGGELYVVVRNNALSTQLSQIKGTNPSEFMQLFDQIGGGVVSIDAEYFGYRNEDGLYLLNKLLGALEERNTKLISVGDYVDTHISESLTNDIDGVNKSSLGMNDKSSKPYLLWDDKDNKLQKLLWELLEKTTSQFEDYKIGEAEDLENVAIWNEDAISDEDKRQKVSTFILFNKVLCSDQFASVSDPNFIKQMLEKYKQLAQNSEDEKYEKYVSKQVEKINKELDTFEDNHLSSLLPSSQSK